MVYGDLARLLEAVRHLYGVNALVQELLRLFVKAATGRNLLQHGAGKHNDAGGAVADFVVLGLRKLNKQLCHLVLHVHVLHDRRSVVGDGDFAVLAHEHLIHAYGEWRHRKLPFGPRDVRNVLLRVLAARMFAYNDERPEHVTKYTNRI